MESWEKYQSIEFLTLLKRVSIMAGDEYKLIGVKSYQLPAIVAEEARTLNPVFMYDLVIKKHRDKKTLSQNAYFHKLIDVLSREMSCSFTRMKNEMIGSYGTVLSLTDVMITVPPEILREWERPHAKYIKTEIITNINGVKSAGHWYRLYKNVEDMNTAEMARLITGTIQECENLGLDVATPDEKAHFEQLMRSRK